MASSTPDGTVYEDQADFLMAQYASESAPVGVPRPSQNNAPAASVEAPGGIPVADLGPAMKEQDRLQLDELVKKQMDDFLKKNKGFIDPNSPDAESDIPGYIQKPDTTYGPGNVPIFRGPWRGPIGQPADDPAFNSDPKRIHHEQSETIQRLDGKWVNVYGKKTPKAGQQLPDSQVHETVEEAVDAARMRSAREGLTDEDKQDAYKNNRLTPEDLADPKIKQEAEDQFIRQREIMDYWKNLPQEELRSKARDDAESNTISPPINRWDDYMKLWKEERAIIQKEGSGYKLSPKQLKERLQLNDASPEFIAGMQYAMDVGKQRRNILSDAPAGKPSEGGGGVNRGWSKEDTTKLKDMREAGLPFEDIASKLGKSVGSVAGKVKREGITPKPSANEIDQQALQLENMVTRWAQGKEMTKDVKKAFEDKGWTVDLRRGSTDVEAHDPTGKQHYLQP